MEEEEEYSWKNFRKNVWDVFKLLFTLYTLLLGLFSILAMLMNFFDISVFGYTAQDAAEDIWFLGGLGEIPEVLKDPPEAEPTPSDPWKREE